MGKYVIKTTKTGIKFDLKAGNGEIIANSEVYTTKAACLNGIESVKKNAPLPLSRIRQLKVMKPARIPSLKSIQTRRESSVSA